MPSVDVRGFLICEMTRLAQQQKFTRVVDKFCLMDSK